MRTRRIGVVCATVLLATVVGGGCGKKDEQAKKTATQVIAKVDSEEISVHQMNAILSKLEGLSTENVGQAKWEVLNKLIDQQLAVNKAVEGHLDRKPEVQMAIDAAKREILARAYLQELTAAQVKPTSDEIRAYYADHPELFSQRRIYKLQQISLRGSGEFMPALREKAAKAKDLDEIATWLRGKNIQFNVSGGVRAAEQLPMDVLPKLFPLKDGQSTLIENNGAVAIFRLVSSQLQPVDDTVAAPRIQQFLTNQRASEAVQREMKALKEKSKIEYMGEFAGGQPPKPVEQQNVTAPAAPQAKRSSATDNPPMPETQARSKPAEPAPPRTTAIPATDAKTIEKGLSSLK